ncbi:serine/threonine-protein phosphatase PP-X isozyme 2 [Tanacetum coccineum]|uniref:Serine/threonine-protein phosphatase PP-X isozyme 2 n=1 Tax=Tanacetum coccineum TaxID=301880 RepID=A0ABQ4YD52_9ASTR
MCDLLWSDPEDNVDTWGLSPHGAGFLFGGSVVTSFNHTNDIDYICRAHQLVMDGCGNVAAILELYAYLNQQFRVFEATPQCYMANDCNATIAGLKRGLCQKANAILLFVKKDYTDVHSATSIVLLMILKLQKFLYGS